MKIPQNPETLAQAQIIILMDCLDKVNKLGLTREMYARKVRDMHNERTKGQLTLQAVHELLDWLKR